MNLIVLDAINYMYEEYVKRENKIFDMNFILLYFNFSFGWVLPILRANNKNVIRMYVLKM